MLLFLKLWTLVPSIFVAKALKGEKVNAWVSVIAVFNLSHGEHNRENTL